MKLIKKTMSTLAILNLILPMSSYSQTNTNLRVNANEANQLANQAFQELQHSGTEFYLDSAKQKPINPRDFLNGKNLPGKIYAVSPYDRALRTRVAFSSSYQITQNSEIKLTIEILKNETNGLKAYPIRAIKTVTLYGNDANTAKIKASQAIRAALSIAQGQMTYGMKTNNPLMQIASKTMEWLFPSAHAGLQTIIGNVIMVAAGAILIKFGFSFLTSKGSEDFEVIRYIGGGAMMFMGFKMAKTGVDYLTKENKTNP